MFHIFSFRIRLTRNRTFSLIELSVAVATMGILAAIAIPTYLRHTHNAQDKTAQSALVATVEDARALTVYNMGFFPPFSPSESPNQASGSGNLITNGMGEAGDLTNWGGFDEYVATPVPAADDGEYTADGFFRRNMGRASTFSSELIPVDRNLYYEFYMYSKDKHNLRTYLMLRGYDSDKLQIGVNMINSVSGSAETTLTQPLAVGDMQMHIADSTGWFVGGDHRAQVALWPYVSATGVTETPYGYTRHIAKGAYPNYHMWDSGGISGNTITLRIPWPVSNPNDPSGVWPVGTPVSNHAYGGSYMYKYTNYNTTFWEKKSSPIIHDTQLWPGTAYVRAGNLLLYTKVTDSGDPEYDTYAGPSDHTGYVFRQIDPNNATGVVKAWDIAPYEATTEYSSGPNIISISPKGTDNTQMMYASLSDSGVCWVVLDNLIGQRTYGKITTQACQSSLILESQVTAASFADA